MKAILIFAFLPFILFVSAGAAQEISTEQNRAIVEAFDSTGHLLHSGLGFAYDEDTIICSYHNVQGASLIELRMNGEKMSSNRLISYNDLFDLAVLKAEDELPLEPEPAGSSMLGTGDPVYFYSRTGTTWQRTTASVKGFLDSGKGYEIIQLAIPGASARQEASPLYNGAGKTVGWLSRDSTAVSIHTIAQILSGKTGSVPLPEVGNIETKCGSRKWHTKTETSEALYFSDWVLVRGTAAFPFQIELPKEWIFERKAESRSYLLEAVDEHSGVCITLRASPQQADDLRDAIEKAETLLFSGFVRSVLDPYSADHFTGFLAHYEDLDPNSNYSMDNFYAMSGSNLYILSLQHPVVLQNQIQLLMEQLVSSLRL